MKPDKIISYALLVLCVCVIVRSVQFINSQYKWSPIDEFAHMDYVDKVAGGTLPALSDTISDELYQSIITDTARSFLPAVHSRLQLGLGNYSYEAIHPPLYYAVLAIPDFFMKKLRFNVTDRLKVLRLISYFIFEIGIFLCIPVFNLLRELGYKIPGYYAIGCALFGLIVCTNQRYGLGNNMMSPLMINASAYFLLQYYIKPSNRNLYLFLLLCCLSVFTAISNIFIVPVLCLFLLKEYRKHYSHTSFIIGLLIIGFAAMLFFYWKKITAPNPLIDAYIHAGLSFVIPAGKLKYVDFWKLLSEDLLTLSFIKEKLNVTYAVLCLFVISNVICLVQYKEVLRKNAWLLYFAFLLLSFLACTFLLNRYVAAVYWIAFRHYLGFIPVMYVAFTGFIPVLYSTHLRKEKQEQPAQQQEYQ